MCSGDGRLGRSVAGARGWAGQWRVSCCPGAPPQVCEHQRDNQAAPTEKRELGDIHHAGNHRDRTPGPQCPTSAEPHSPQASLQVPLQFQPPTALCTPGKPLQAHSMPAGESLRSVQGHQRLRSLSSPSTHPSSQATKQPG